MIFDSIRDVILFFDGIYDWKWQSPASFEGLCKFAWENFSRVAERDRNKIIRLYIISLEQDPKDYGL
jgi:hypothetical protein